MNIEIIRYDIEDLITDVFNINGWRLSDTEFEYFKGELRRMGKL